MSRKDIKRRKRIPCKRERKGGGLGSEDFVYTLDPIRVHSRKKRSLKERARISLRKLSRSFARFFNNHGMLSKGKVRRLVTEHKEALRKWKDPNSAEGPRSHIGKPLWALNTESWQHYSPGDTAEKKLERDMLKSAAMRNYNK